MSASVNQLPAGFEALEPFVEGWAIDKAQDRYMRRIESTKEEHNAFYRAAKDLVVPALAYLDARPLAAFDDKEQRLMNLLLSLAHVAQAVEVQKEQEPGHARLRLGLTIERASSDRRAA